MTLNFVGYFAVFFVALLVDTIPVFAPPAWPFMVFFLLKFELRPLVVILLGVTGSTLGRTILSSYMPSLGKRFLSLKETANLEFLGSQLNKSYWKTFVFVLVYSLTPLSTTALFTAAGLARAKRSYILPSFFLGKLTSDCVMVFSGIYAAAHFESVKENIFSVKSLLLATLGLLTISVFLLIDWKIFILEKKIVINFKIGK